MPFFLSPCRRRSSNPPAAATGEKLPRQTAQGPETRHRGRHHFNGAAGQAKGQRPHGVLPGPNYTTPASSSHRRLASEDSLFKPSSIMSNHFQFKKPLRHAQISPSTRSRRKITIATNAPTDRPVNATANGSRKNCLHVEHEKNDAVRGNIRNGNGSKRRPWIRGRTRKSRSFPGRACWAKKTSPTPTPPRAGQGQMPRPPPSATRGPDMNCYAFASIALSVSSSNENDMENLPDFSCG